MATKLAPKKLLKKQACRSLSPRRPVTEDPATVFLVPTRLPLPSAVDTAMRWLSHQARQAPPEKHAVVFDIDGTLLFVNDHPSSKNIIEHRQVLRLYRHAIALGFRVFLITARVDFPGDGYDNCEQTKRQLHAIGINDWDGIFFQDHEIFQSQFRHQDHSEYKWKCRVEIEYKFGVPVIATIGDKWGDVYFGRMTRNVATVAKARQDDSNGDTAWLMTVDDLLLGQMLGVKLPDEERHFDRIKYDRAAPRVPLPPGS